MGKQMTEQKLRGVLRQAYYWGRDNGTNRSENNFNGKGMVSFAFRKCTITSVRHF